MREILRLLRIREEIGRDDVAAVRVDLDAQHVGGDDDMRRCAGRVAVGGVGVVPASGVLVTLGFSPGAAGAAAAGISVAGVLVAAVAGAGAAPL